jgi:AraC-like DNA-binding protein
LLAHIRHFKWPYHFCCKRSLPQYHLPAILPIVAPGLRQSEENSHALAELFGSISAPTPRRIHPRVNRVLKSIPTRIEEGADLSLNALSVVAGLSPSRFMHVFTESMGMPLRRYILSMRLQRAYAELLAGASVTTAAYSAGFADSPHLTRTFRKVLGLTPRELIPRQRQGGADQKFLN